MCGMLCTDGLLTVFYVLYWEFKPGGMVIIGNTGVMTRRDQMADIPKRVCGEWATKTWRRRRRKTDPRQELWEGIGI